MIKTKKFDIPALKFFLIVLIILMPILYLYIFFNVNPDLVNLKQRARFYSMPSKSKNIDEENSTIIKGTKTKGTVITKIKIPDEYLTKEFTLKIEASAKRNWDYGISGDLNVYVSRRLRIEILINNRIFKVLNYTDLPLNLYSESVSYGKLNASDFNKKLSYTETFDSSKKNIEIQLITEHQLYPNQDIFDLYFYDDNYCLTVCIGDPDLMFYSISIIFLLIWFVFILWLYHLERRNKNEVI